MLPRSRMLRLVLFLALATCFTAWFASADDKAKDAVSNAADEDDVEPEVEEEVKKVKICSLRI